MFQLIVGSLLILLVVLLVMLSFSTLKKPNAYRQETALALTSLFAIACVTLFEIVRLFINYMNS